MFKGYAVFVTIRDCISREVLYTYQSLNVDIERLESPFRSTVSFQLVKSPVDTKAFLPHSIQQHRDALRLIADVTIFDCYQNSFFSRSSFLWLESHAPSIYHAATLAYAAVDVGYLNLQFKESPSKTEIRQCSIIMSLSKILGWFDKRFGPNIQKIPHVSKLLIDISPNEDPLNIFSTK